MNAPDIQTTDVPQVARGHRLQYEPAQQRHVLLYPEGMVTLNDSAAEILLRCDGQRNVCRLCADLSAEFDNADVTDDVYRFLQLATSCGWVVMTD